MKNLFNLGTTLTKEAQKSVIGGKRCTKNSDCPSGVCAHFEAPIGNYPAGWSCL